ncbi:MAG: glycosyltransferase family 2 protein [Gemmatimonadota bacterium]
MATFAIAVPSYNQAQFLDECISSIASQSYRNFYLAVGDGGSSDGSAAIIEKWKHLLQQWYSEPDGGQAAAVNRLWRALPGEWLAWLNSDDYYLPGAFQAVADSIAQHPEVRLVVGNCAIVDREGRQTAVKNTHRCTLQYLLSGRSLPQPAVFFHRSVIDNMRPLDESLRYALDWELLVRYVQSLSANTILRLNVTLAASREYEGTKSSTGLGEKAQERLKVVENAQLSDALRRKARAGVGYVWALDEWRYGSRVRALAVFWRFKCWNAAFLVWRILAKRK